MVLEFIKKKAAIMEANCSICNILFEINDEESKSQDSKIKNTVGGGSINWICPDCSDKTNDM